MKYNISNRVIRGQISNSTSVVSRIFAQVLIVTEILAFQIVDLENIGQADSAQHSI